MPTPSPRKFFAFQLHLSTAIVLMFVAGGLIWANTKPYYWQPYAEIPEYKTKSYGWPFTYRRETEWHAYSSQKEMITMPGKAGCNVAIALGYLVSTWLLCEWVIHRRRAPA